MFDEWQAGDWRGWKIYLPTFWRFAKGREARTEAAERKRAARMAGIDDQADGEAAPELTPEQAKLAVGAMSKLVSASVGDVVVVMSRAPSHKHYSLADIEWMVLPPVLAGQFYVAEAAHTETGARAPVAAVTWAKVSAEVDVRLTAHDGPGAPRLRPDEWTSGETVWLVDLVGDSQGLNVALKTLQEGAWKGLDVKVALQNAGGEREVRRLADVASSDPDSARRP